MKFYYPDELKVTDLTNQSIADAMQRFWQFQYQQSVQEYNAAVAAPESAKLANTIAEEAWRNDIYNSGWDGPKLPYTNRDFEMMERRILSTKSQYLEAKAMYDYFMRFLLNKAHPEG